jgi:hypothetical protein
MYAAILLPVALASRPLCFDFSVPIHVSVPITQFDISPFNNNSESTGALVNGVTRTANVQSLVTGKLHIDRSYDISFRYCEPSRGIALNGNVQVLTHGLGFDKSCVSRPDL